MVENKVVIDRESEGLVRDLVYRAAVEHVLTENGAKYYGQKDFKAGDDFFTPKGDFPTIHVKKYQVEGEGIINYKTPATNYTDGVKVEIEFMAFGENSESQKKIKEGLEKIIKAKSPAQIEELFPEGTFDTK